MPAWVHRIRQGLLAFVPRPEPDETLFIHRWLTEPQRAAFMGLSAHDRGHLVRVARELIRQAPGNHDLILAGLLHDIGKANGSARVLLIDRTAKVLLEQLSPRLLGMLTPPGTGGLRAGLTLAVHHAETGAEHARQLGCSERVVWLIKHHEDSRANDVDLRLLIEIDRITP